MPTSQIAKTGKPILDGRKQKLRPYRQDQVRAQIQVGALIKVVQNHALGIGDEVSATRLHAAKILIDKVLPNAIPEAIEANNQAQAIQAIQQAQLLAMAKEMLNQGVTIDNTLDTQMGIKNDSYIESKIEDTKVLNVYPIEDSQVFLESPSSDTII
jgi:hypothetical protein